MTDRLTKFFFFICLVGFISCVGEKEEEITGSIMEYEFVDKGYNMEEQPEVIQYFFQLDPQFIGDGFCYNSEEIQELILDTIEVNETAWNQFEIDTANHYLLLENAECYVTLEFRIFEIAEKKHAYLNQVSKSDQRFDHLIFDASNEEWIDKHDLPRPKLTEYFEGLSDEEKEIVNSNGYQFIYMKPHTDTLKCLFSEWKMGMELEYKGIDFNIEAAYSFALFPSDSGFVKVREEK